MKKYIAIALLMVLGTAYPAYARWSVGTAGGGVAGAVCAVDDTYTYTENTSGVNIGYNANQFYVGTTFTPSENITVCAISFKLTKVQGDLTGKTYTVGIYDGTYEEALPAPLGTSSIVCGESDCDAWSNTDVKFTFSSPVSLLTANAPYSFMIYADEVDTTNVARMQVDSTTHSWSFGLHRTCTAEGAHYGATTSIDVDVIVWTQ
jgi:hypothetical protein